MDRGSWHCTGDRDQDHPHGKEMQKSKMAAWEALQTAVKRREAKSKGEKKRYKHLNAEFQRITRRDLQSFPFCCFPLFLCIDRWRRLSYSSCYSLKLCIQMLISFLFSFAFCFSSFTVFVRPPQTAILPFCISFPWRWSWSLSPVPCHEPHSIVHQALYQI